MKKINSVTYDVSLAENITIEVTPTDFGASAPAVAATLDGEGLLTNVGSVDAPIYEFTVSKPVGRTHRVFMEFSFQFDAPAEAAYQVAISGQDDEGCPCGFVVTRLDQVQEVTPRFRVRADALVPTSRPPSPPRPLPSPEDL